MNHTQHYHHNISYFKPNAKFFGFDFLRIVSHIEHEPYKRRFHCFILQIQSHFCHWPKLLLTGCTKLLPCQKRSNILAIWYLLSFSEWSLLLCNAWREPCLSKYLLNEQATELLLLMLLAQFGACFQTDHLYEARSICFSIFIF